MPGATPIRRRAELLRGTRLLTWRGVPERARGPTRRPGRRRGGEAEQHCPTRSRRSTGSVRGCAERRGRRAQMRGGRAAAAWVPSGFTPEVRIAVGELTADVEWRVETCCRGKKRCAELTPPPCIEAERASGRTAILEVWGQEHHCPEGYEDYKYHVGQHFVAASSNDTVAARATRKVDFHRGTRIRASARGRSRSGEYCEMITT